jgi:sugar phosphate isomerase/epimerase
MQRRDFIRSSALAFAAANIIPSGPLFANAAVKRKFKIALNPGIIGVKANFSETLDYAIKFSYEAISPYTEEVMENYSDGQLNEHLAKMKAHNISYDSINIPVEYRLDEARFREDFKGLKRFCQTMEKQGATRINTWIISSHDELTYNENMRQHASRLGECAKVMQDHGIKLGLEYLGMRTLLSQHRYPFIASLKECRELIDATGQSNVGFILDSYHWYCANDTLEDLHSVKADEIITIDINDARAGFSRVEQVDGKRELPLATGVIDLKTFLQGIIDINYDGPIRTEPFNEALNELENEEALKVNINAIRKSLALVGM